ncbi:MAG TPA: flagellar biosynthesis regulator FlaF [Devosia sp.]|jgi:flagellar protein FlaF|nr:flagellar biosynthesis regulator FlaF [Devosia sp.]
MQNQAVTAYQNTSRSTVPQRDLEANLLSSAAAQFQRIMENWEQLAPELENALLFNRKLWTIFVTSVTDNESKLAMDVRQNVANLGVFVLTRTAEMRLAPEPDKLDVLVRINRELAAGLRGSVAD